MNERLADLAESHQKLGVHLRNEIESLKKSIIDSLHRTSAVHQEIEDVNNDDTKGGTISLPEDLANQLSCLERESCISRKTFQIIESLQFDQISERVENIAANHPSTFEWLFQDNSNAGTLKKRPTILQWLLTGHGIYWISGKAGSGKSTLMKFLHNERRTIDALRCWATNSRLVIASFFFSSVGTKMQKSQKGLLQTFLFHIMKQVPELIPSLCASRWQDDATVGQPWSMDEILTVFRNLKEQSLSTHRFCFFIDGADEYEGDHMDLINVINTFIWSDNIKICFSSRPWVVFESFFGDNNGRKIHLQDLNRSDIICFVREKLTEGAQFRRLKEQDVAYENLVWEIVERSSGVFLWVFLVVRSLRRGMSNLDTVKELQQRLRELPTELEEYFEHMLNSTDKSYHQQAARIYKICLAARRSPRRAQFCT